MIEINFCRYFVAIRPSPSNPVLQYDTHQMLTLRPPNANAHITFIPCVYCSIDLIAAAANNSNQLIIRLRYRNYVRYTLYRSRLPIFRITIVRLLSF